MAKPVIELKGVTKSFGSFKAINNVSLAVEPGQVFGFLGPNGAGKSTTINMLVDLIRPTEGKIKIFGLDSVDNNLEIRQRIGYLNSDMALDESLTGSQQLAYFIHLRGQGTSTRIKELAKLLDVSLSRKIKTLSRGNRQKIGLISALMHDPDLLILDEPTSGLDPIIQAQFNKIILEHKKRGKTTFMSSHVLSEVQEVCDHVAFIKEGQIINVQSLDKIAGDLPKLIILKTGASGVISKLKKVSGVIINHSSKNSIELTFAGNINDLLAILAKHDIRDLTIQDADLETVFMEYYQKDKNV